jgi:hypothetical protein
MASVHEGLTLDDDTGEPSDAAFAASLEEKFAGTAPEPPPAPVEAPAPRDPSTGRFVAAAPEATPQEDEGTPSPTTDAEARLREKDAFIGRQSNEIGELRSRLEALEAVKNEPEYQEVPQPTYISEEQAELIVERAGPEGAVMAAINDGVHPDNPVFKTIFDTAAEAVESQSQLADLVELRLRYRQAVEEAESEPETPANDEAAQWARDQYQKQRVEAAVSELKSRTPDFDNLAPYFEKALEVSPLLIPEMQSGDPERLIPALGTLLHVARGVKATSGEATAGAATQAAQQAAAMRQAAQVATGALRPVATEDSAPPPGDREAQLADFREKFRATLSPTIQDGLSIG